MGQYSGHVIRLDQSENRIWKVKHKISFWHQPPETLTLLLQIVQDWYFHHVSWKLKFKIQTLLCSERQLMLSPQSTIYNDGLPMKNEDEQWIISAICCLQHCFGVLGAALHNGRACVVLEGKCEESGLSFYEERFSFSQNSKTKDTDVCPSQTCRC